MKLQRLRYINTGKIFFRPIRRDFFSGSYSRFIRFFLSDLLADVFSTDLLFSSDAFFFFTFDSSSVMSFFFAIFIRTILLSLYALCKRLTSVFSNCSFA